jgi:hypothetical protein
MTQKLTELGSLIRQCYNTSDPAERFLKEDASRTEFRCEVTEQLRSAINAAKSSPSHYGLQEVEIRFSPDDADDDELDNEAVGSHYSITLRKSPHFPRFIWLEELLNAAHRDPSSFADLCVIGVDDLHEELPTVKPRLLPWRDGQAMSSLTTAPSDVADWRGLVHCSDESLMRSPMGLWLLRHDRPDGSRPSTQPECWRHEAFRRYAMLLSWRVWRQDNVTHATLRGRRPIDVIIPTSYDDNADVLDDMHAAVEWIYRGEAEAQLRHQLLGNELTRLWHEDETLRDGMGRHVASALQLAKTAYELRLDQYGLEAQRSLTNLRQTVASETRGTQDAITSLRGAVWQDALMTAGAVISTLSDLLEPGLVSTYWALAGIITFILTNAFVNLYSTSRAVLSRKQSFEAWMNRIYRFVQDADRAELADRPMRRSMSLFWCNWFFALVIQIVLVVILVLLLQL